GTLNTNANPIIGTLGTINIGGSVTVTLTVIPKNAGSITNTATVGNDIPDSNASNDTASSVTTVLPLPVLSISRLPNQVQISWPAPLSNFTLQFAPAMSPGFSWSNLGVTPIISGSNSIVTETNAGGARYYRLKQ